MLRLVMCSLALMESSSSVNGVPFPPRKPWSKAGLYLRSRRPTSGTYHSPFSGVHWACQIQPIFKNLLFWFKRSTLEEKLTIRPASRTIYFCFIKVLLSLVDSIGRRGKLTTLSASMIVCRRCATVISVTSPLSSFRREVCMIVSVL